MNLTTEGAITNGADALSHIDAARNPGLTSEQRMALMGRIPPETIADLERKVIRLRHRAFALIISGLTLAAIFPAAVIATGILGPAGVPAIVYAISQLPLITVGASIIPAAGTLVGNGFASISQEVMYSAAIQDADAMKQGTYGEVIAVGLDPMVVVQLPPTANS